MRKKLKVENPKLVRFYLFELSSRILGAGEKEYFVDQVHFVFFEVFELELLEFPVFGNEQIQKSQTLPEGRVHVILDTIIGSTWEIPGYEGPSIAIKIVELNKCFFVL